MEKLGGMEKSQKLRKKRFDALENVGIMIEQL